ncbi:MAG: ATP-dependent DNA helicase RecG [Planctomycetota bacterium]
MSDVQSSSPEKNPESKSPEEKLTQNVRFLKKIGVRRAELLEKLGIRTAADVLFFFPRRYQDFTRQIAVAELNDGDEVSVIGTVDDIDHTTAHSGRHVLYVLIKQESDYLRAFWFNQSYMVRKFQVGQKVMLQGKVKVSGSRFQMTHPRTTWIDESSDPENAGMLPVYKLTDGINQRQMRELVWQTVEDFAHVVEEAIPDELRQRADVCDIGQAIRDIHSPESQESADLARTRLVYQELLILQLALAIRRHRVETGSVAHALEMSSKIRARIKSRLPFDLSPTQLKSFNEIAADMSRPFPMNRLLHGDVGSGKTAVALCSMLLAVAHGHQAAMMAPTEILAAQHYRGIAKLLAGSRVKVALLTGSMKPAERRPIVSGIESGEIDIVIGTQAIASDKLKFDSLALAVVDEQHKFGVRRRASLKQSGHDPHYLVMTATPIPRTVSMTLFGDLDVSVLDRPEGVGAGVFTYLQKESSREQWWEFVCKKLREGRQAYVVAPLVDSGDESELGSAERLFESLSNGPFSEFRLDVLHGRQTTEEKDAALQSFEQGRTQVIVATGVVEVGINVPNATVMTIESAERFGLAQLHQLRGRVSRGVHPGFVCAFCSTDDKADSERLQAFEEIDDGFELAETDLRIRGPGNLFSTRQTGFPPLFIADLFRDAEILARAQADARLLVDEDPELEDEKYRRLRQLVFARYGSALALSDVG